MRYALCISAGNEKGSAKVCHDAQISGACIPALRIDERWFLMYHCLARMLLTNRLTLYMAKISPYAFLIHVVVFYSMAMIYYHIPNVDGVEFGNRYGGWINATIGFLLTVVCSELWMRKIRLYRLRAGKRPRR